MTSCIYYNAVRRWPVAGRKKTASDRMGRGRPEGVPLCYSIAAYSGLMVCFLITDNAPRPFLGLRCGVPPRQAQINNDASGNP